MSEVEWTVAGLQQVLEAPMIKSGPRKVKSSPRCGLAEKFTMRVHAKSVSWDLANVQIAQNRKAPSLELSCFAPNVVRRQSHKK